METKLANITEEILKAKAQLLQQQTTTTAPSSQHRTAASFQPTRDSIQFEVLDGLREEDFDAQLQLLQKQYEELLEMKMRRLRQQQPTTTQQPHQTTAQLPQQTQNQQLPSTSTTAFRDGFLQSRYTSRY